MSRRNEHGQDVNEPPAADVGEASQTDQARRKLLKIGVYAPPLIVGSLLLSRDALAQTASCAPATCVPASPCQPDCSPSAPCNPDGGACNPDNPCSPQGGSCNPDTCNPATP